MTIMKQSTPANIAQSQTDSSLVAAVANRRIRVYGFTAQAGGTATTLVFNSKPAGSGTAISPTYALGVNEGASPFNPNGLFDTNEGEGLSCSTGTGSTTGIQVNYGLLQDPWK